MSALHATIDSLTPDTLRMVAQLAALERLPGSEGEQARAAQLADELQAAEPALALWRYR